MITFKQFKDIELSLDEQVEPYSLPILSEELHQAIHDILNSQDQPVDNKLNLITKEARRLIAEGKSTGFENDKPKKGSSRAVFFPSEHKEIELDGQRVKIPTAVKIAFPGLLDRYTGHHSLLGEEQNRIENNDRNGVIRPIYGNMHIHVASEIPKFETNEDGVTVPLLSSHPDAHYLEMGRADKYNVKDLRRYTKNSDFKTGLSHIQIQDAMFNEHSLAHGGYGYGNDEDNEKIAEHPHVMNMINAMHDMGLHPADLRSGNMGIWQHPLTNVRHPVMIDYGFSNEIAKLYQKAQMKKRELRRGY